MGGSKLTVLTTGGTIASRSKAPLLSGRELTRDLSEYVPGVKIEVEEVCRVGSSQMTLDAMWSLGRKAAAALQSGSSGVVVTHGTDTLEETAYFLDLTAAGGGPVVVTGSMRGQDSIGPEGMANLVEACKVALAPEAAAWGALVVMNDRIHAAREAAKVHSWLLDAFASPESGPAGYVGPAGVNFTRQPLRAERLAFSGFVSPVDLLKLSVDCGDRLVRAAVSSGTKGLVVETLGFGNIPQAALQALRDAIEAGVPVVLTSRCLTGGAPSPGTVRRGGFILSDLSGPKARIKLMLALSLGAERSHLAKAFAARP